jgi:hypothetical protein
VDSAQLVTMILPQGGLEQGAGQAGLSESSAAGIQAILGMRMADCAPSGFDVKRCGSCSRFAECEVA